MFTRTLSALVLAAATITPAASRGSLLHSNISASTPKVKKVKMVQITLKNKTNAPMDLMIEDKPVTIAANGVYELKAAEGTRVFATDKTLKLTLTRELDGTTCSFH